MTKITFRPDQAAVAAEMLDLDQSGAAHLQSVAPFDDHRALLGELLEAKVRELRELLDPVQVDVRQLHSTRVDADQLEGWARDRRGRPGASRDSSHEGGLPRSQLAGQQDHVAGHQALAQVLADGLRLRSGVGDDVMQTGPTRFPPPPPPSPPPPPPAPLPP